MSSWEEQTALMGDEFDTTETPARPTGGQLPDGRYQAARIAISRVEPTSWDPGIWQLYLRWVATRGEHAGQGVNDYLTFDRNVPEAVWKARVAKVRHLGYDGTFAGLKDWVEAGNLIDGLYDIAVVTKPGDQRDFTNVYLNSTRNGTWDGVTEEHESHPEFPTTPVDDDDIPF